MDGVRRLSNNPGGEFLGILGMSSRQQILVGIDEFRSRNQERFNGILNKFGWTKQSLQGDGMVQCPVDSRHWVPESSLSKHTESCQWVKEGYTKDDYVSAPSSSFFYKNHTSVFTMKIDQETQNEILSRVNGKPTVKNVPRNAERARTDFTQAEKLAVYDYVVAQGQESRSSSSKLIDEVEEELAGSSEKLSARLQQKTMSRLQLLKQMRDYKRRRQSYRAKNVHITKRSQTEIMREIIANQMEETVASSSCDVIPESYQRTGQDTDARETDTHLEVGTVSEMLSSIKRYRQESGHVDESEKQPPGKPREDNQENDKKMTNESGRDRVRRRSASRNGKHDRSEDDEKMHRRRDSSEDERSDREKSTMDSNKRPRESSQETGPQRSMSQQSREPRRSISPPPKKRRSVSPPRRSVSPPPKKRRSVSPPQRSMSQQSREPRRSVSPPTKKSKKNKHHSKKRKKHKKHKISIKIEESD